MAALGDEVLDGFMYPTCAAYSYSYPYPAAAKGGGGWRPRSGGCPASSSSSSPRAAPAFPGCGQLTAAEYLDSYQRAQLTALLSQVSPGLAARPRRAGSRDAAVQVNPRRDVSVQCSLGRRSLPRRARDPGPDPDPAGAGPQGAAGGSAPPRPARRGPAHGSPPGGGPRPVRFPRTVAVYSPVVSRCLTALLHGAETAPDAEPAPPPRPRGPEQRERAAREAPQPAEEAEARAAVRASWEQPAAGPALPPREPRAGEGAPRRAPGSPEQPPPRGAAQDAEGEKAPPRSLEPGKERPRFQFLEQKYGYYHCKECNIRWESAYVWCVQGTNKVYFKQFCRTCQKSYNPYRVEDITCQSCKQTRCSCSVKLRHVDPKRPHRQDLCGRCKGKRLSCDSTFSFKYII
ncbi:zygote arrest protein 1 [Rousettus aegyptiacus]|uniref:Zygote arrest 1 n=1 Tax=Rousettus aegyptiacus TaxID=9407 RepID=A0A7J8EBV4_ROUAE|nr:zygote arrest protein 1 [Rousettus aegyptiacus]KAF6432765.1 zygote arrest 1 [Rousettus aegyptiacus]